MITDLNDLAAAIGGGENDRKITNQNRQDWNKFIQYLDQRKLKGHPSLDKNNLGNNMLAKYIKENPATSLTTDIVIPLQKDFANYRQWSIDQIHQGKGTFAEGTDEHNFMRNLSVIDGKLGQQTSSHLYPKEYLQTFENGNLTKTEDQGFAVAK